MKLREIPFRELNEKNIVSVSRYQVSQQQAWDEFVRHANNGTVFHTRKFLSYHPDDRFEDCSLIFTKRKKILSVLPAVVREEEDGISLISHAGSSFGGPVFQTGTSLKDTFFLVDCLLDFAAANKIDKVQLTLPPLIYSAHPGNYFDFALLEAGFTYCKREVSSVIPLDFADEDILLTFSDEARRAARKAMKSGVVVRESEDYNTFYALLENNLKLRHGVRPTHTLPELLSLRDLFPDDIRLFSAEVEGEMIAGIVLFVCNARSGLAFYISHREDRQEFRGVNLLFVEVIRWCIQHRLNYLDFGIFTVNMRPNWGLARFKESFGALGIFRDTFVKIV